MNTQDFKPFIKSWEEIYALQGELQLMYRPYFKERIANFDINTLEDQELFKKLCWQIVEELTEAMEAKDKNEKDHVLEELIDAFNFMLELYQLYGMAPDFAWGHTYGFRKDIADENFEENILELIKTIGLAANCLKNREWRQSQYMVDLVVFEERLWNIWAMFAMLFESIGVTEDKVRELWSLKYQVNLFRIKSKY
nr:MAG: dUTPase [Bacteriophage sp.]UVY62065.1 MAG: dUTPase [Bacteriophage sp.]